ncbi:nitroreductase family protein [Rhizobium sp. RU36D]|uniref:nitroreductase family protein n=1 Tax=Rhizobium sp. RU36D TaxID=1907415 RepID=UPI0009D84D28|nr:nitroreductase family protein [Rhizobium sp. RU36D]SMC89322.1 Nitroreductase [Rhizobium sp. RU36D]
MIQANGRQSDYNIHPLFLQRWSPRAFTGEAMPEDDLMTILEAAHWAPSAGNGQPWRFIYGHRGTEAFNLLLSLLDDGNQVWAKDASVLVFVVSETVRHRPDGTTRPIRSHSFDAGAAWAMLALQATMSGYLAHGMGGVNFDRAQVELDVPSDHKIEAAVAIGKLADLSALPDHLREREKPNGRNPLDTMVFEGKFRQS